MQETANKVASACMTFEEWASETIDIKNGAHFEKNNHGLPKDIILHGHCHEKALIGMQPAVNLLSKIPDCTVTLLDSDCCGVAGSFGYEKEHHNISKAIGERVMFSAFREREPDTIIAALGFSCRQ